jgi:hypothetical protein
MVSVNVWINLAFQFIFGVGTSIHDSLLVTPFLISLGYSVIWVGYVEGAQGLLSIFLFFLTFILNNLQIV